MTDARYVVTRIGKPGVRIKCIRKPDDTEHGVLRASIGGTEELGFYLTFRGEPDKVAEMLKMMSYAAGEMLAKGNYKDDR